MPISEDEFDYNRSQEPQSTMSKAELRKTHKPIMEKRRRARINHCLNEIKTLILEALNKDPSRHSKLEKADILEMAVKHLQNVQRQQLALAMATDPSVLRKFKTGFNECATEIDRYITQIDGVDNSMKQRVSSHLQKCIGGIEQVTQFNFPGFSNLPILSGTNVYTPAQTQVETTSNNVQQRSSAFVTVIPQAAIDNLIPKPLSPPMSPVNQGEIRIRNPSPHGFRPVLPNKQRNYSEDPQVSQISSTVSSEKHQFSQPLEVKTLRFPIHKYPDKEKRIDSPKKIGEPLCIITNQSERYKQAQMKEDSANFEENIVQQDVKRTFQEVSQNQGLLTISQHDFNYGQTPRIVKSHSLIPAQNFIKETESPSISSTINDFPRLVPKVRYFPNK
ncbi:hypothetical protein NQ314_006485 [Rhamnusium bicolor]|uniref:Uncharacterized protein n=1 Tax=Rhamnusium bicolor TaxID=1586634 RepID=A0AAV8Z0U5_9CUCU|nr:hypothetical protein NQ314_006485 [Rhamnusium bicolor]